ncbi:MAG TPA: hypothetical protein VE338_21775 [Ktedonobacterales bacterium]|nr:hypothetical protein [Ktedonobacterales bacterium]
MADETHPMAAPVPMKKHKPASKIHTAASTKPFNPHAAHKPSPQLHSPRANKAFNPHAIHRPAPQTKQSAG